MLALRQRLSGILVQSSSLDAAACSCSAVRSLPPAVWEHASQQSACPSTSSSTIQNISGPHAKKSPPLMSAMQPSATHSRGMGGPWSAWGRPVTGQPIPSCSTSSTTFTGGTSPVLQQLRSIFGVAPKKVNKQIHTHDKYKQVHPQPTYPWMVGRFIKDRNGVIWHRQANSSHHRHAKSASQLTRLKRLKPLAPAFARKLRKLGFKRKFWLDPDVRMVPGFHTSGTLAPLPRHEAKPDLRRHVGDPALRQS